VSARFLICILLGTPGLLFASSFFELESSIAKRAGEKVLSISLKPKAPWKISQEAPVSLDLSETIAAIFSKKHYSKDEAKVASENEIRFELQSKLNLEATIPFGVLRFYLCSDKGCRKFEESLKVK